MIATLRGREQFAAFASAQRFRSATLSLRVTPSLDPGYPRVGYAIGRSVGNSVVRNRLRRRMRAIFAAEELQLDPSRAYLVVATIKTTSLTFSELKNAISEIMRMAQQ